MNASHERPAAVRGGRLSRWVPRTRADWGRLAASLLGWGIILATIGIVVGPAFHDIRTLGTHDWDQMESHRYLLYKSVHSYGQFPFWNPYGCGGHPSWAGIESGTTIVSPWLPFYLFAPLAIALKVEIAGTALISAIGTWLLAGRFTRSAALRAFCCAVFVVNGRWALQAAAGHTWHLYYAWTPWTLYFFDRAAACDERSAGAGSTVRWRDVVLCGACIAMMVYTGAIYPLPQTVLALGLWSILLAASYRTRAPDGRGARQRRRRIRPLGAEAHSGPRRRPQVPAARRFDRDARPARLRRDLHVARSELRLASCAAQPVRLARVGHLHRVGGVPCAPRRGHLRPDPPRGVAQGGGPGPRGPRLRRVPRVRAVDAAATRLPSSSRSTCRRAGCTRRPSCSPWSSPA